MTVSRRQAMALLAGALPARAPSDLAIALRISGA
jgi:hypothetical protein